MKFMDSYKIDPLGATKACMCVPINVKHLMKYYYKSLKLNLPWKIYLQRVLLVAATSALDIGLSQWSLKYITVALYTMTKTSAISLAPRIRVNGIAPGPTLKNKRQSEKHFKKQYLATPLKRQVNV